MFLWWKKQPRHEERGIALVIAGYIVLAMLLLPAYEYHLLNDSFAYLSLAATGQTNPYWGPMFPWLIALFVKCGLAPLMALRLISVLACVILLVTAASLRKILPLADDMRFTAILTLAGFLLLKTLDTATPDLLLTALLALSMRLTVRKSAPETALAGVIAGIGYLTKSVALPFFLVFLGAFTVYRFCTEPKLRNNAAGLFCAGIGSCIVVALPWIIAISSQQGHLTIGESAHVIHATMTPLQGHEIPMNVRGLLAPGSGVALSIWDDPTALEYHDWSPLASGDAFVRQLKIVILNAVHLLESVASDLFLVWILLCGMMVMAFGKRKDALREYSRLCVLVWAILFAFYLPIVTDDRYVWPGVVCLIIGGALLLQMLSESARISLLQRRIALTCLFLGFTLHPAWTVFNAAGDGRAIAISAEAAASVLKLSGARTASDNWKIGLAFSYFAHASYYGRPKSPQDPAALSKELRANGIDEYIVTGAVPVIAGYREIVTPAKGVHILHAVPGVNLP